MIIVNVLYIISFIVEIILVMVFIHQMIKDINDDNRQDT
jgi:hypothetical protein